MIEEIDIRPCDDCGAPVEGDDICTDCAPTDPFIRAITDDEGGNK